MSTRLQTSLRGRILDAAAVLVARHGIRKTTMEDVAHEASCSRAGLYKHFTNKDALLQALFLREVEVFLSDLRERVVRKAGPRHLEDAFVFAVRYVREHPVAKGVLDVEPEMFMAVFAQADQGLAETAVTATASLVSVLMQRGDIRKADPRVVAELLLRLLVSFVLSPRLSSEQDEEASMRRLFGEVLLRGIAKR